MESSAAEAKVPGKRKRKGKRTGKGADKGVAILMVLAALAILIPFTATFNRDARVDWQSSINASNEVKARNLERGALRLSVLMFEIQRMVFNQKQFRELVGGQMDITMIAPYLMSIFGSTDGAEALGSFVGVDTSALNELAVAEGSFEVRLEAESGKVNVNCLAVDDSGGDKTKERTVQMLEQLMAPQLYDSMFDEEKSDGQRYNRFDVLAALVDYIDDDRQRYDPVRLASSSQGERYRYTELYDAYEPRNARLDTIEELNLVQGIDDDWMAAFGSELTVYGNCKVNLNFASPRQIAMVLKHAAAGSDAWKTEGENFLTMTMPLANFVVESRQFNLFEKLNDVKTLVAKPDQFTPPTFLDPDNADPDNQFQNRIPDGLAVRVNGGSRNGDTWGGLRDVSTVEPERYYRLEIITQVGAARKRLDAVYDLQYARSNSQGKGAWLYYREE